jgi:small conductance mechanosensitive channel
MASSTEKGEKEDFVALISVGHVLADAAIQLVLIILLFVGVFWLLRQAARRVMRRLEKDISDPARLGRLKTLVYVSRSVLFILLLAVAVLMVLHALGVNILPLLTGAGLAGLALTLGAQILLKDFFGGLILLIEGQFNIGDTITVGSITGVVERITLRATYVRDFEGRLNIIPNGDIRTFANLTNNWARAVVYLNLPFDSDVQRAVSVLEEAMQRLQADSEVAEHLLEAPQVNGWFGLSDWAVRLCLTAKTRAGRQWQVAAALRRYALEALKTAGIRVELPFQTATTTVNRE